MYIRILADFRYSTLTSDSSFSLMEVERSLEFCADMMSVSQTTSLIMTYLKYPTNNHPQVFLNIVLDDAVEEKDGGEKVRLGMVVCICALDPD
jgi:hypothetical protein